MVIFPSLNFAREHVTDLTENQVDKHKAVKWRKFMTNIGKMGSIWKCIGQDQTERKKLMLTFTVHTFDFTIKIHVLKLRCMSKVWRNFYSNC